jgi:hypothetical protein
VPGACFPEDCEEAAIEDRRIDGSATGAHRAGLCSRVENGRAVGMLTMGDTAVQRDSRTALADISAAPPNTSRARAAPGSGSSAR